MAMFRKLVRDTRGVGAIEYALVASLISIAAISGYSTLGARLQVYYSTIQQAVSTHL
jgi:Flp pilus assembly pilin Flp